MDVAQRIASIYRYPVKGLSAEPIPEAGLDVGGTVPFDRAYAIEIGPGRFDPASPRTVPKVNFLMLMRYEALALLQTAFDEATATLTISRDGRKVVAATLSTPTGRAIIAQFFSEFLKDSLRGPPKVVHAEGHAHTDLETKCLHIISQASIGELERIAGHRVDPLRFRPNLVLEGAPALAEFDWVGRQIAIGDTCLEVFERTERCAATNVNPTTGRRDLDLPALLQRQWGHRDFGVYARVTKSGKIRCGDGFTLV